MAGRFPSGASKALTLTFDDARASQVSVGMPVLDRYGIAATFYVLADAVQPDLDAWQHAAASGHEIGNHTTSHPCSANHHATYSPAGEHGALEDLTLEWMSRDIDRASDDIEALFGTRPSTFAYPCGH